MSGRFLRLLVLAVVSAALLAVASPAWADSLVYVKGSSTGDVWIAHPDGTAQRQVTHGGGYSWPSEADNGTIAALGPGRTAPDGTRGMDIYKMDQSGSRIGSPIPTPSDYSTLSCPTYPPNNMRISPDGSKIAYDNFVCNHFTTFWTPSNSTGLNWPNQTVGQENYGDPFWMDNTHLLLSHVGVPWNINDTFTTYATGAGDNSSSGWFGDTTEADPSNPNGWATGFNAAISRQGSKLAIYEDDAANWWDGNPRQVVIRLFTTTGAPPAAPTFRCQINLPASRFPHGASNDGLSFSPDGTQIAWEDTAGIHTAQVGNLSDCSAISQRFVISGGIDPFWSPANLQSVDTTAPTGTIKINAGHPYTRSPSVTLSLSATDPTPASGIGSMRLMNDGGSWSAWIPYAATKSWTLRNANGTRSVYVQYKDRAGNISATSLDRIILDTIKTTITGMSPKPASITRDTTPRIKATVRDNLSNLGKANIRLYVNGGLISPRRYSYNRTSDLLLYNSPRLNKGKKVVKVIAGDAAGNVRARSWYYTIR